jgi:hypothetical protein
MEHPQHFEGTFCPKEAKVNPKRLAPHSDRRHSYVGQAFFQLNPG